MNKIHIIGLGFKPLGKEVQQVLSGADDILASGRLFDIFREYDAFTPVKERIRVIKRVDETVEFIRNNWQKRHVVLLASGDPMFFGIGRRVVEEFGQENVSVLPDLSSIQIAFSRIKEPWDDAFLMSLHGGPDPDKRRRLPYDIEQIPGLLERHHKIAVLTDKEKNPSVIAGVLMNSIQEGVPSHTSLLMHVCERLGYRDEKITSGPPAEIAGMTFSDPNVVIIIDRGGGVHTSVTQSQEPAFGLTEAEIAHTRGLITKDEVRAVSIHKLRLAGIGVLWDIGAGSGSVSMEAAKLSPELKVYAVEKDEEQCEHIEENKLRFGIQNVTILRGTAPEVLKNLPAPDRVFIGGSGGRLPEIIGAVCDKMTGGIIVINAVALETLNEALVLLGKNGFEAEVSQISVSRSKELKGRRIMSAMNPVFIIRGERK